MKRLMNRLPYVPGMMWLEAMGLLFLIYATRTH